MLKDTGNKKKVVIITNIPAPYRVALYKVLQERQKEFEWHIVYSAAGNDERDWDANIDGLENVHFLSSKRLGYERHAERQYYTLSKGIGKLLKQTGPDAIIASEYNATAIQAFLWCKLNKVPYITLTDGTLFSEREFSRLKKMMRRLIIPNSSHCIASSTKSKELQLHYGAKEKDITVAYLTVDINKFGYKREKFNSRRLLYVGSLIYRKGLDLLLEAAAKVDKDYELTIIGNGPEKETLEMKANYWGISDRVSFLSFLEGQELIKQYHQNDIFVFPTREDCFGLVINEAMAASMPVITSKYAEGSYDLVLDGENGIVFDPEDTNGLVTLLNGIIGNDQVVKEMGEKSYKHIQEFSLENTADKYVEAITKVIE